MQPALYESVTPTGGVFLGRFSSCFSCEVKEVRNGEYSLSLSTTTNDDIAPYITVQKYIKVKPNPHDSEQYFRITKIEKNTDNTYTIYAHHIKTEACSNISTGDGGYLEGTPATIYAELENTYLTETGDSNLFTFTSDITATQKLTLGVASPALFGNILAGTDGSFVDLFGGEYYYDNFKITLCKKRGTKRDYKLKYGQNISSATQTESSENTYSRILPYASLKDMATGGSVLLYAPIYEIPVHECVGIRTYLLDCTEKLKEMVVYAHRVYPNESSDNQGHDAGEGYAEAEQAMTNYAQLYVKKNTLENLEVNIVVNVESELAQMQEFALCDEVTVVLDKFNSTTTAKITEVVYDCLSGRWKSLTVGSSKTSLADIILDKRRYIPNAYR